eukprot:2615551-Amphidinium_carterae.1
MERLWCYNLASSLTSGGKFWTARFDSRCHMRAQFHSFAQWHMQSATPFRQPYRMPLATVVGSRHGSTERNHLTFGSYGDCLKGISIDRWTFGVNVFEAYSVVCNQLVWVVRFSSAEHGLAAGCQAPLPWSSDEARQVPVRL